MIKKCLALFCASLSLQVFADDKSKELGADQKLKQVYQLYRINETVALNPSELRLGLGFLYSTNESRMFDLRESSRYIGTQASLSYGLNRFIEVGVTLPVAHSSFRVESSTDKLFNQSTSGLGQTNVRVVGTLPISGFEVNGIASVLLPTGNANLINQETYSSVGFNIARNMRPAFVYGGLSWQHSWESQRNAVGYNGGFGFHLNHSLSMGSQLTGVSFLDPAVGRPKDMVIANINLAYQINSTLGVTPSVGFGVTESAPDLTIGFNLFWRVGG